VIRADVDGEELTVPFVVVRAPNRNEPNHRAVYLCDEGWVPTMHVGERLHRQCRQLLAGQRVGIGGPPRLELHARQRLGVGRCAAADHLPRTYTCMRCGSPRAETQPEQARWTVRSATTRRATMARDSEPVPIACSLTEADLVVRRDRWLELAGRGGVEMASTENGLRLTFPGAPGVEGELRQLAELERDCCAFAGWSVRSSGAEVVLDVTAESELGIAAVEGMFHGFARHSGTRRVGLRSAAPLRPAASAAGAPGDEPTLPPESGPA
jgi:hypothetical protein